MKRYDLLIIGAGPAGLSAAIEAAKTGMKVIVFDENKKPGGQLFKQIHKFFGSNEQHAGVRGVRIGEMLLEEAGSIGIDVELDAAVLGIYADRSVSVMKDGQIRNYESDNILIATGASERALPFEGWDLPGVVGAGAAQTMMNLYGVKPGKRILMIGSGNVGLVVSYQMLQAGCEVVALVDAAPRVGGYGVHAAKLTRNGVPFYLSHTVVKAHGRDCVTGVTIGRVDSKWQVIPGTEKYFDVDLICMAVGLNPMSQLARMAGAKMIEKGGQVPWVNEYGETSVPGIFAAGDVAGIEEASSAMITGSIAGIAAARKSGFIDEDEFQKKYQEKKTAISELRKGTFSPENRGRTDLEYTDEGMKLSQSLFHKGYIETDELKGFPGVVKKAGVHPVIECTQNIPCDPCQKACAFGCISIGKDITALPTVNPDADCRNCGKCVAACSGQAIFLVDENYDDDHAAVTIPYEFYPLPEKGEKGIALGRDGAKLGEAEIISVRTSEAYDHTAIVTMKVDRSLAMTARAYRKEA